MKRITAIFLLLSLLFVFASCENGDRTVTIDENAFLAEAKTLLSEADALNAVLFEPSGIPVNEDGFVSGKYKEVYLYRNDGFDKISIAAIKEKTESVYTTDIVGTVNMLVWNPEIVDGEPIRYARYIEYRSGDKENPHNGTMMAYTGITEYWSDAVSIDTDSIRFVGAVKEAKTGKTVATVTVDVTVTNEKGDAQTRNLDFRFVLTDDGYRLDDLVTLVYDESLNK